MVGFFNNNFNAKSFVSLILQFRLYNILFSNTLNYSNNSICHYFSMSRYILIWLDFSTIIVTNVTSNWKFVSVVSYFSKNIKFSVFRNKSPWSGTFLANNGRKKSLKKYIGCLQSYRFVTSSTIPNSLSW